MMLYPFLLNHISVSQNDRRYGNTASNRSFKKAGETRRQHIHGYFFDFNYLFYFTNKWINKHGD